MMTLPTFSAYCENTTAANALLFDFNGVLQVWFSYKTPVAYSVMGGPKRVRRNDWGPTTGKHINAIDGGDKSSRISGEDFERGLARLLGHATFGGSDLDAIMSKVLDIAPALSTSQMLAIADAIKPIDDAIASMTDDELRAALT